MKAAVPFTSRIIEYSMINIQHDYKNNDIYNSLRWWLNKQRRHQFNSTRFIYFFFVVAVVFFVCSISARAEQLNNLIAGFN